MSAHFFPIWLNYFFPSSRLLLSSFSTFFLWVLATYLNYWKFIFYANSFCYSHYFLCFLGSLILILTHCIFLHFSLLFLLCLLPLIYLHIPLRCALYDYLWHRNVNAVTHEWWKCNWNINRIFHTSRDLPKAIGLFAFITIIQLQRSW